MLVQAKLLFSLNTNLVSVRGTTNWRRHFCTQFKYKSCVGSRLNQRYAAIDPSCLNTNLVSVRALRLMLPYIRLDSLNTNLVSVREYKANVTARFKPEFKYKSCVGSSFVLNHATKKGDTSLNTNLVSVRVFDKVVCFYWLLFKYKSCVGSRG